jgi:hypothetical protein
LPVVKKVCSKHVVKRKEEEKKSYSRYEGVERDEEEDAREA